MNWGTVVWGAALAAVALVNDQLHWLPPLQIAGLAIAALLIGVAPRPAWVALVIAGIAAYPISSAALESDFGHRDDPCSNGTATCVIVVRPASYAVEEPFTRDADHLFQLPFLPAWLIVLGVLGWAIRRRSWRTAVAGAVYGLAVMWQPHEAPIVLLAAAAAALGPRKDVRYLAGLGILALALIDQQGPWTLLVTIIAIVVTLALAVWALVKKDGVNGAVALVALASASLTPFLSAGVLLAASLVQRRAWFGLAAAAAVIGWALYTSTPEPTGMQWLSQDQLPARSAWQSPAVLILGVTAFLAIRRRAARSAGTPNR
ncbi:hypothetical protein [Lentzea sp. NPDC051838]|uniref:hypothetical protein n=1 Tax=Lentzea sp. NPDC051838 TaxID=3154849 RepID=UPI003447A9D7